MKNWYNSKSISKLHYQEWLDEYFQQQIEYTRNIALMNIETCDTNIRPSIEFMIWMLEKCNPVLLEHHKKLYRNSLNKNITSFEEYMDSKCWQMWESLVERKKEQEWEYSAYYSGLDWINHQGEEVVYDIFRKNGDIESHCEEQDITDFRFLWWGFNQVVK
jgi:hypothetical protein